MPPKFLATHWQHMATTNFCFIFGIFLLWSLYNQWRHVFARSKEKTLLYTCKKDLTKYTEDKSKCILMLHLWREDISASQKFPWRCPTTMETHGHEFLSVCFVPWVASDVCHSMLIMYSCMQETMLEQAQSCLPRIEVFNSFNSFRLPCVGPWSGLRLLNPGVNSMLCSFTTYLSLSTRLTICNTGTPACEGGHE